MDRSRLFYEGLMAGITGYIAVVICVAIIDVAGGRVLFETPSLLGQILIGGFGEPTPGSASAGPVLAYNGIHLLAFVAVGLGVAWLVFEVELHPVLWYGAFVAVTFVVLLSFLILSLVGEPHTDLLPRTEFLIANAVAATAIGWYLHRAHPRLAQSVSRHADPEYEEEA